MALNVKPLPSIILIDPVEESRDVLAERLKMQGFAVTAFPNPAEGAHAALSSPPAAVIADLWMPSISGVQLCRLLKAEPATEHVPVVLRGPEAHRNRFWAERAGASAYVVKGRMGDLVRALARSITSSAAEDGFFCQLASETMDIRDRIASHLDTALFESVIASDIRALSLCGAFDRLFDLFTQFMCQIVNYRWLVLSTEKPFRFGLHTHPAGRESAEPEARAALGIPAEAPCILIEDEDALNDPAGVAPEVVPVRFVDTVLGRLALAPLVPLDAKDKQLISVIAREIAGPVRMATLVEEAQRLATVDPLTGLMNRRAFLSSLDLEFERSMRLGYPVSLIMLDVDHFKHINDQRGHASGDNVLAAMGKLLAHNARRVDLVARWGGEEFIVLLAATEGENARAAAERLRGEVAAMVVGDAEGEPVAVTASLGLAVRGANESAQDLIDRADRAMYAAKSQGRNRVVVAMALQAERLPARPVQATGT